ncbi:MAG TPA: replication-relaxation family protein [Patescibacteria group bacterium]|nr:replication-relaxation family protein [Patescibacteria group bacterium]
MTGTDAMKKRNAHRRRGLVLQARDFTVLHESATLRVADREQLKVAAGFNSTTRVNTRLLALARAGLLRRFFLGSGGGRKALYALAPKGAQMIGVPCRGPRRPQNATLVADFFIEHQLRVNDLYCALKFGAIPFPDIRFVNWIAFHEPLTAALRLIPDGYVELSTSDGIDGSFLEVDLGHEGLPIWKEKARNYLQLALSGEYERLFRHPRFRVLVLLNSERRLQSVRAAVAQITEKVFWFATLDAVKGEKFFASVWQRPTGEAYQPLFKEIR